LVGRGPDPPREPDRHVGDRPAALRDRRGGGGGRGVIGARRRPGPNGGGRRAGAEAQGGARRRAVGGVGTGGSRGWPALSRRTSARSSASSSRGKYRLHRNIIEVMRRCIEQKGLRRHRCPIYAPSSALERIPSFR